MIMRSKSLSAAERSTSKIRVTAVAVVFTCWPPGPEARAAVNRSSDHGNGQAVVDFDHAGQGSKGARTGKVRVLK